MTKVDNTQIQKARNIFNLFSQASLTNPKTDICRALAHLEQPIQQELSILDRLGRLQPGDERRNVLPMSLAEANRHFREFRRLVDEADPGRGSQLLSSDGMVETLLDLPSKPGRMKSALHEFLNGQRDSQTLENVWLARFPAIERLVNGAVTVEGGPVEDDRDIFARTIIFEPEYRQAGIAILSYFGEIVQQKYPDADVRVRIEQHGNTVVLHVETPTGQVERFEQELTRYGLVVTGRLSAAEYMTDRLAAMRLEHKLELAEIEVRHTRNLLESERASTTEQIGSLKKQVEHIQGLLDLTLSETAQSTAAIRGIAVNGDLAMRQALEKVASILESGSGEKRSQLEQELQRAMHVAPTAIDRLNELLIKGSIQGAAGNYLYSAMQVIQKMF